MLWRVDHPRAREFDVIALPLAFAAMSVALRVPAPTLGQHTDEVLTEPGIEPARMEELKARKVVR